MNVRPATVKRSGDTFEDQAVYDDGYLRIEHANYYIAFDGKSILLPRKEFLIISRLARNPGRIVSFDAIWRHAWGEARSFNSGTMRVYIHRLRQKLEPFKLRILSLG